MSTSLLIYLYIVIGNLAWIPAFLIIFSIIGIVCCVVLGLDCQFGKETGNSSKYNYRSSHGDKLTPESKLYNALFKFTKPTVVAAITSLVMCSFYPNKQDLALIVGGTALVSVAQTEEAQKLPENVLKAANAFLEGVYEHQE